MIGHESFALTEKVYTHKKVSELRKAIELVNWQAVKTATFYNIILYIVCIPHTIFYTISINFIALQSTINIDFIDLENSKNIFKQNIIFHPRENLY